MIELAPFVDKKLRVKFVGGREVVGILRGADAICNLVLDDTVEYIRGKFINKFKYFIIDANDPYKITKQTRELGFLVARGTTVN